MVHVSILLSSTRTKIAKEKRNIAPPYITRQNVVKWLPIRTNKYFY